MNPTQPTYEDTLSIMEEERYYYAKVHVLTEGVQLVCKQAKALFDVVQEGHHSIVNCVLHERVIEELEQKAKPRSRKSNSLFGQVIQIEKGETYSLERKVTHGVD